MDPLNSSINMNLNELSIHQLKMLRIQNRYYLKKIYFPGTNNYLEAERVEEKLNQKLGK